MEEALQRFKNLLLLCLMTGCIGVPLMPRSICIHCLFTNSLIPTAGVVSEGGGAVEDGGEAGGLPPQVCRRPAPAGASLRRLPQGQTGTSILTCHVDISHMG